jgi:hypothetical protein
MNAEMIAERVRDVQLTVGIAYHRTLVIRTILVAGWAFIFTGGPSMHPPEHWRRHAQEARQLAAMMSLPDARLSLLKMAEDYDRQAKAVAEEERSPEQEALQPHAGGPGCDS